MPDSPTDGATTTRRPTEQSTPRAAHQWRVWFVVGPHSWASCSARGRTARHSDKRRRILGLPLRHHRRLGSRFALVNALNAWPERWQWGGHVALALGGIACWHRPLPHPDPRIAAGTVASLTFRRRARHPTGRWMGADHPPRSNLRTVRPRRERRAAACGAHVERADRRPEVTVNAARFTTAALTALAVGRWSSSAQLGGVIVTERWLLRLPPLMIVVWASSGCRCTRRSGSRQQSAPARDASVAHRALVVDTETAGPFRTDDPERDLALARRYCALRGTDPQRDILVGMVRASGRASRLPPLIRMRRARGVWTAPHERRGALRYACRARSAGPAPPPALG
jgi:hypothetical protein